MNPHSRHLVSPWSAINSLWRNRSLIALLAKRELVGRYRGSVLGLLWSFLNPLMMLLIYYFVFSTVFKARWGQGEVEGTTTFAVLLFVGMVVHNLFSEILTRAPSMIVGNVNYVKKIVFPLEILPAVTALVALFHALVSLSIIVLASSVAEGRFLWTAVFIPLVILPQIILTIGLAWGIASLGVYLRDIAQPIAMVMSALLFASPVFYPVSALPEFVRPWILLNPLTFIIEQARDVLVFRQLPNWVGIGTYTLCASIVAWLGYAFFQRTRKGFANVL